MLQGTKELQKIWSGFRAARVLITANTYRVFDHLRKPRSAWRISGKLNTDKRATEILLDALTGIGLLKKQQGEYCNRPIASRFLVSGSPYYQGDIIRHADSLWKNWSGLDEVIRTGKPYHQARDQESFILGMHNLATLKTKDIMKAIRLKGVNTALDLGGGPGTYSIEMAKRGIQVTLFDVPDTIKIARRIIQKENIQSINFVSGDFMIDDIGKGYDLIFISQILHAYSEKDNLRLLRKCQRSLNDGGRIVIQDFFISKDRTFPHHSALFSINMLVNTEGGRCYSSEELKKWLSLVRLKNIEERFLEDTILITGRYTATNVRRRL